MKTLADCYREINKYFNYTIDDFILEIGESITEIPPMQKDDYLSASSMPYLCPRMEAICLQDDYHRTRVIDAGLQMIFETGNAFQVIVRDKVAKNGMLVGMWRCETCDYVHGSTDGEFTINSRGEKESILDARISRPETCGVEIEGYGKCDGHKFEYIEETIVDDLEMIKGHPDGFLVNAIYDHVWEIKTVNAYKYKEAKEAPFDAHLEQAMWYAFKTNKKGVIFTYFNKDTGDYVNHVIDLLPEVISNVVQRAKVTRKAINEFYETGSIKEMPERVCNLPSDPMAKRCEVCDRCFSLDLQPSSQPMPVPSQQ